MQTTIHAGGRTWIVEENLLINWLVQNAVQPTQTTRVVREVVKDTDDDRLGRMLLNENR
jgi:hypothetical protein